MCCNLFSTATRAKTRSAQTASRQGSDNSVISGSRSYVKNTYSEDTVLSSESKDSGIETSPVYSKADGKHPVSIPFDVTEHSTPTTSQSEDKNLDTPGNMEPTKTEKSKDAFQLNALRDALPSNTPTKSSQGHQTVYSGANDSSSSYFSVNSSIEEPDISAKKSPEVPKAASLDRQSSDAFVSASSEMDGSYLGVIVERDKHSKDEVMKCSLENLGATSASAGEVGSRESEKSVTEDNKEKQKKEVLEMVLSVLGFSGASGMLV